ncbi:MAG TPA: hypothetical protein VL092_09835 [Chitinophagaceae bacterium]|nr:hypothetical protein [Chitinophagaceae bacterium]
MIMSQCMLIDELHRYAPYGFAAIFKMFHNIPEHDVLDMFREANEEVLVWVRSKTPLREKKIAGLLDMVLQEKNLSIN